VNALPLRATSTLGATSWQRRGRGAAIGVALVLAWIVGYPLVLTLIEAFRGPEGATLDPFVRFVHRPDEWMALRRTLFITLMSVLLAAGIGVPLAFLFERVAFPGSRLLGVLVTLPVALPPLVGVIAFLFLYGESGFLARGLQALGLPVSWRLTGPWAILLVHAYSMYVYFYLFVRSALARLDPALDEAAAALGASPWRRLVRVTLPMLRPALSGASLLVFMTALASFSAPYIFGGGYRVMTTQITASKLNGDLEMAEVETIVLAGVAVLGLLVLRRFDRGESLAVSGRGTSARSRRTLPAGWRLVLTLLAWGVGVVLLLPHLTLILLSLVPPNSWTVEALPPLLDLSNYRALFASAERWRPILTSTWMASAATVAALVLGVVASWLALRRRGLLGNVLAALLTLPWAIPGTVFAIALATSFSVHAPHQLRFVLIGTPLILPLAYLVRSLPLTGRSALAGMRRLDPALEEAAASLGAGAIRTLLRVVVPVVRPAVVAGASLAFLTALGDLVSSIVLYTYQTRPIAIEILSSLRLQELGLAAVYGVLLMALSTLAFLLWGERAER
jgi:iron(III) transport system permease protein